ncbi:MAG: YegS/Rv2252/BmrU family lipid kinase [Spirochaetia bacterium]|nr:YegS/Rv2252/BmrU family lipid kinase [Spirochaetia bacterium]
MSEIKVIVNPASAHGLTGKNWPHISTKLESLVGSFSYEFTNARGHATEIARKFLQQGGVWIISVGGDGTLNEIANAFFKDKKNLYPNSVFSVINTGTGGDFIKSIKSRFHSTDFLGKKDEKFTDHKLDVIQMDCKTGIRYFINMASFGLGGQVVDRINRYKFLKILGGKASYYIITLLTLLLYKNKRIDLKVDGQSLNRQVQNIAIANGIFQGGGMKMAPDAILNDGLMEIILFENLNFFETIFLSKKIYSGEHIFHKKIKTFKAKIFEIQGEYNIPFDLDGETWGYSPANLSVIPSAIKIRI